MESKPIDIPSFAGALDTRSPAAQLKLGEWRYVLNAWQKADKELCRVPGWDKLLTRANYNNQDLHDQLLAKTGKSQRRPLTFLFQATSIRKNTTLLSATGEVIFAFNPGTGNWKSISDRVGQSGDRWRAAQSGDTVILSNGKDPVVYWQFDQGITEANDQSVAEIADLRDTLEISKAGTIVVWNDHLFLMNVVVAGTVKSNGIYWSNYQRPLDLVPSAASTAGSFELDSGETILGALPLGSRLLIYTDKSIWEVNPSPDGDVVFTFAKRYTPQQSAGCLFYPRTLISLGNQHAYAGVDGIYYYNLFQDKPQRIDFIHRASGLMFESINRNDCEATVAGYNEERKELLFSYAKGTDALPSETFVVNTDWKSCYYMDRGFSAMVNFVSKEPGAILRNFLLEHCICSAPDLGTYWGDFPKEGGYCTEPDAVSCPTPPASIYTVSSKELEDGVETEDYDQAEADEDSLCAQLGNVTLNQLCEAESRVDECRGGLRFVVADAVDYCLKELNQSYYRETCTDFTACGHKTNASAYPKIGYRTLFRSGPINGGEPKHDKLWTRFQVEAEPVLQTTPSKLRLRIGSSALATDPNKLSCPIVWEYQESKDIDCQTDFSAGEHIANDTIPDGTFEWPLYSTGRNLYFELEVLNPGVTQADTGGGVCFSRMTIDMVAMKRTYV